MDRDDLLKLIEKVREATHEVKILYELSESEMIVFGSLILDLPVNAMSAQLLSRLLRAAAHFIERNEEIAGEYVKQMKR